jgi:nitroreductase
MPITDVSREYINLTFLYVGDMGLNIVDDFHGNKSCCSQKWIENGLIRKTSSVPLSYIERLFLQTMAVESGFIIQNMTLMAEALGIGGF